MTVKEAYRFRKIIDAVSSKKQKGFYVFFPFERFYSFLEEVASKTLYS